MDGDKHTQAGGDIKSASMDCTDDVVCTKETFAALVCRDVRAVFNEDAGTSLKPNCTPISSIHDHSSETGFLSHSYRAAFAENHLLFAFRGESDENEVRLTKQSGKKALSTKKELESWNCWKTKRCGVLKYHANVAAAVVS